MKYCPICTTDFSDAGERCPHDGARLLNRDEWAPGTVIRNKYRVVSCIGRGGMGIVYKAEHLVFKDIWALKVMNPRLSQEAEFVRRFYFEAEKQRRLKHRNVVRVDDVDQSDDGRLFIGMEFVDGMPLREMLHAAQGPLAPTLALAILRGVAEALEAADALGIVHRDIKPDNILLERAPAGVFVPKLTDFGVAKLREGTATIGQAPLLTPQYAAPEQWQPSSEHPVDGRTDLYALGMTGYEMLTGRLAFDVSEDREWMYAHLNRVPPPPSRYNQELDARVDALVLQLIAKNPDERPAGARELIKALTLLEAPPARPSAPAPHWGEATVITPLPPAPRQRLSSRTVIAPPPAAAQDGVEDEAEEEVIEEPAAPPPPPPRRRTSKPVAAAPAPRPATARRASAGPHRDPSPQPQPARRRSAPVVIALVVVMALAMGGYIERVRLGALLHPAAPAASPTASVDSGTAAPAPPITPAPAPAAVAPATAAAADNAAPAAPQPPTRPLPPLMGHTEAATSVAFSPRAHWLASGSQDQSVRVWEYATGASRRTLRLFGSFVSAVAFSPNGRQLAAGDWDKNVQVIDVATGALTHTLAGHTDSVEAVAFSPNGNRLASGSDDRTVRLWNPASGESLGVLHGANGAVRALAFSPDGRALASGGEDDTVYLWNVASATVVRSLTGHNGTVRALAYDPHGRWLASASEDATVRLWGLSGQATRVLALPGHVLALAVAFSPDGRWLAAGGSDNQIRIWAAATGDLAATLQAGSGGVRGLAFSADGSYLAAACGDHSVRLWQRPRA